MLAGLSRVFAYPALLGFLAFLPILALLFLRARRKRRRALAELGNWLAIHRLLPPRGRLASWTVCLVFTGLILLILGIAGPRWGRDEKPAAASNRGDLVVVLDVSRSMLAEQPSRQERAVRALRDLAGNFASRGGPRVALVVFAAYPKVVFPLTGDYDHFRHALAQIDADDLPPSLRPHSDEGSLSGTRIGAGLRKAMELIDPKNESRHDIILLSDGDDPVADQEYVQGAEEARRAKIPVHVIGVGDPTASATIPFRGQPLQHGGVAVQTRLNEAPLEDIANRTGGVYIPARNGTLALGQLFREIVAKSPQNPPEQRSEDNGAEADSAWGGGIVRMRPRHAWFLGPALGLFALTLLIGRRRHAAEARWSPALPRLFLVPFALLLVSAGSVPLVDQRLGHGNDCFAREDYEQALKFFDKAEEMAPDPGLVAFNKAATLYRLGRFREAEFHYQRTLDDEVASAARKARAWFGLANSLVNQGGGRRQLEAAIAAYRQCLSAAADATLQADARYNLELARLLWIKAKADDSDDPENPKDSPRDPKKTKDSELSKDEPKGKDNGKTPGVSKDAAGKSEGAGKEKSDKASGGALTVLPDQEQLAPLSPQETEAHLDQLVERILRERRAHRRHAQVMPENVKDW
ncbi:MAG: VWA domain-containing protein [Planctomycetes bacterium]|nr:VWA domain-containing protein [Planctomycetota bacterium]